MKSKAENKLPENKKKRSGPGAGLDKTVKKEKNAKPDSGQTDSLQPLKGFPGVTWP